MEILRILHSAIRMLPPETMGLLKDSLPTAKAAIDVIEIDKKLGEIKPVLIIEIKDDNAYLHVMGQAIKSVEGKNTIVLTRSLAPVAKLLP